MTARQADPEIWALVSALHDLCKRRNVQLAVAAQLVGDDNVIVARVGSDRAVADLLDNVRNSLFMHDIDDTEGSGEVRH